MTTSVAPLLACLASTLLALTVSGFLGLHYLPPWLEAPFLRLRAARQASNADRVEFAGPEGVLVNQLKTVDSEAEPEKAYALHTAIGNILRSTNAESERVVHHFKAARNAAARGSDPDALLAAHLDLADAYIEDGHALDSHHELAVASGVMANHFAEHSVKLNRGLGRAKFELGYIESALQYFEQAEQSAVKPEEIVRVACDIGMAQTCLGQGRQALQPLRRALDALQAARKVGVDGGVDDAMFASLAADVHLRLAEAFHSVGDTASDKVLQAGHMAEVGTADATRNAFLAEVQEVLHSLGSAASDVASAEAHYKKALYLQQKSLSSKPQLISAIKDGLSRLQQGIEPQLRCPSRPRAPWDVVQKPSDANFEDPSFLKFIEQIRGLWSDHEYNKATSELLAALKQHPRPYRSLQAAATLNMLGDTYRMQKNFPKAAQQFRQALHAVSVCDEAVADIIEEANRAFSGLRDAKGYLSSVDQRVAVAALHQFQDIVPKLDLPLDMFRMEAQGHIAAKGFLQ